jgi:hypothetical protein
VAGQRPTDQPFAERLNLDIGTICHLEQGTQTYRHGKTSARWFAGSMSVAEFGREKSRRKQKRDIVNCRYCLGRRPTLVVLHFGQKLLK